MFRFIVLAMFLCCFWCAKGHSVRLPEKLSIASEIMAQERLFYVRLPIDYQKYPQKRYPVVYQLQSRDTFLASYSAVDNLTASGQMPDVVLVGIEHKDKFSELSIDSPESVFFYRHLIEELKPFIESHYRIEEFSVLSGWSVGGGFVVQKMMQSAPFNAFLAYSPAMSSNLNHAIYKTSIEKLMASNGFLILSVGNEQGEFLTTFKSLTAGTGNYAPNVQSKTHKDFAHRGNAYISQYYGFKALFKGWTPSKDLTESGLKALQQHYQKLSKTYGFPVEVPKQVLLFSAYSVLLGDLEHHREDGAELVSYTLQKFPETRTEFEKMQALLLSQQRMASYETLQTVLQNL